MNDLYYFKKASKLQSERKILVFLLVFSWTACAAMGVAWLLTLARQDRISRECSAATNAGNPQR